MSFWIIIIIMAYRQHRFPWPSRAIRPYRPLLSVGLPCYILYQYRAVVDGCLTLTRLCEGVHRSTSLTRSPLFLQQYPACFAPLIWTVFEISGRCPYSCCSVECCLQDLFNTAHRIRVQLPLSFLSIRLISIHVVHPYSSIDSTAALKKKSTLFHLIDLTSMWPIFPNLRELRWYHFR